MGNMPQPIFMSHIAPRPLFGSPPKVNTFAAKEEKVRLQVSGKSAASGLPRQLMGLNINLQDVMAKANQRATDARAAKRKSTIESRRGVGPSVSSNR